ncbi:MAG TPA: patatin family protein [Fibrobacteria bacterium]|nr:patatin family protein [Fibrobacteria bacterium]HOX52236.1 patatin family protein [Fibrobacteria bacterium]
MKRGLVLEGGGMRGLYTAGVLDVLMERGVEFDGLVGVSAGAVFGCNYKSRQIGRALRYNTEYCRDPRYISLRSLLRTGDLYEAEFCYRTLPEVLDPFDSAAFGANPLEFHVVCTDVRTGRPVYHGCETGDAEDVQWMRASASMPLVSNVVRVGGMELLDGGIADSIPIAWARDHGYDRNVVVLTQPAGYRKKKSALVPLLKFLLRKHPKLAEAMARRPEVYNASLDELESLERAGKVLVFRPRHMLPLSRTERNPDKLRMAHRLGREAAEERLEELRAFLR